MATRITILNWAKFNPRKDVKSSSWFRLDHGIFENPDFYDFSHAELVALIYLLSIASKKNSGTFAINYQHAERIGRLSRENLDSTIKKLQAIQFLNLDDTDALRARHADDTRTCATDGRTDVTNGTGRDVPNVPQTKETNPPSLADQTIQAKLTACVETWNATLAAMKLPRKATEHEKQVIFRAVKNAHAFGGIEQIDLALYGARHEPKSEDYDPKDYADAARVLEPNKKGKSLFTKFIGWGSTGRAQAQAKKEKPAALKPVEGEAPNPEVVRQLIGQWSRGVKPMPKETA